MIHGMINRVKALTGVYSFGFERESMLGIALPVGFVVVVGGIGFLVNRFLLS
ncbi:MAG: hypothetical protein M3R06_05230 [Chloroflexota bacterium]|nr:hypothetical protein [Chloroflexota bacterium]